MVVEHRHGTLVHHHQYQKYLTQEETRIQDRVMIDTHQG